jgi:hypothetical protein
MKKKGIKIQLQEAAKALEISRKIVNDVEQTMRTPEIRKEKAKKLKAMKKKVKNKKEEKDSKINKLVDKLHKINFQYCFDIATDYKNILDDPDPESYHHWYGECTILGITNININNVLELIFHKKELKELDKLKVYCIERLLRKFLKTNLFEAFTERGYYNDDVCVKLSFDSCEEIAKIILADIKPSYINSLLIDEYGFLIGQNEQYKYYVENVEVVNIKPSYPGHKTDSDLYATNIKQLAKVVPIAICKKDYMQPDELHKDQTYTIVDGHHRVAAAKKMKVKTVDIIVMEPMLCQELL